MHFSTVRTAIVEETDKISSEKVGCDTLEGRRWIDMLSLSSSKAWTADMRHALLRFHILFPQRKYVTDRTVHLEDTIFSICVGGSLASYLIQ